MEDLSKEMTTGLAGKSKAGAAKKPAGERPKYHSTHIRHTPTGHHVVHYHEKGSSSHFVPHGPAGEGDLDNLHAHLEHHLGAPNAGEEGLGEGVVGEPNPAGGMANLGPEAAPAATPAAA
jgi:hypothetical protein